MQHNNVPDPGEIRQINFLNENTNDIEIRLDPAGETPALRPMHGVCNYAPLQNIGMACPVPVLQMLRALKVPYSYFHDTPYENPGFDHLRY